LYKTFNYDFHDDSISLLTGIKNDTFVFPLQSLVVNNLVKAYIMRRVHAKNLRCLGSDLSINDLVSSLDKLSFDTKLISDDNIMIFDLNDSNVLFDGKKISVVDCDFYSVVPNFIDVFKENSNMFCNTFHNYVAFSMNDEITYNKFISNNNLDEFVKYLIYEGDFDCLKEFLVKFKEIVSVYAGRDVDNLRQVNEFIKRKYLR